MDIERAKAVVLVADAITSTAKVEVEMVKHTGGTGSGFIPALPASPRAPALPSSPQNGHSISKGK
jgi:hypothetical protein